MSVALVYMPTNSPSLCPAVWRRKSGLSGLGVAPFGRVLATCSSFAVKGLPFCKLSLAEFCLTCFVLEGFRLGGDGS